MCDKKQDIDTEIDREMREREKRDGQIGQAEILKIEKSLSNDVETKKNSFETEVSVAFKRYSLNWEE